ncbi:DUF6653 family protein [Halopiger xanaduensis]|uniref:Uncharacterized protein n=1 Tax=Halopiger xanaduensis (strain DSM 18323 / JCM 14033 / SH-6) TaxID=797210 RepID=F8DBC7_HALXS|nr:DUF6653 family protein [Halopiger xanaduensis]AEH35906.1 hypothetical protein Halxa_1273 [Halopiger xanaduensis SH-6]
MSTRDGDDAAARNARLERFEGAFWERHANPKSGWSRVLLGLFVPVALYRRDWRLLAVVAVGLGINPIFFARPDPETENWMTRGVRAERWWLDGGDGTFGLDWPNVLNTANVPLYGYALYAAYKRRPIRAAVTYGLSMACKFAWIEAIARRYDRRDGGV